MKRSLWLSLFLTFFSASAALPCGFHNYAPQPTIVEQMLDSSSIVLARQSRLSPFKFEVTETLSGIRPAKPIPFLVDGSTRRKLASEDVSVLFVYDEATETWTRLALIDSNVRPVLDQILARLPMWQSGGEAERAQNFANLLNHPSRTIRNLALKELDLVGYDVLRSLQYTMDSQALLKELSSPLERNREPIRVLLIGLSEDPIAKERLVQGVQSSRLGIGPYLGAYATAWIELAGIEAVETLTRQHLLAPDITPSAQRLIVEALALHRNYGEPEVSSAVSREMAQAIQTNPHLAALAAQYFIRGGNEKSSFTSFKQKPASEANPGN